jgi:AraC family transcriptional regulator
MPRRRGTRKKHQLAHLRSGYRVRAMPVPTSTMLPLIARAAHDASGDVRLTAIAARSRSSPFEIHRAFRRLAGEPPKQFTQRLRIERAAAQLVIERRPILEIAIDNGFASHDVFARAFLRRFGMSPRSYRARGVGGGARAVARHAAIVRDAGPCIGLYRLSTLPRSTTMSTVSVTRRTVPAQHALVIRKSIPKSQVAATIGENLPRVFAHAQKAGLAFAGPPFARYVRISMASFEIEVGMPIATKPAGSGEIEAVELYAGPVAFALHRGSYDKLPETHDAIERWIDAQQLSRAGAPWEVYVTDPGQKPNPADWETEVYVPIAE